MENQCDYCFTFFKTKYILKRHIDKNEIQCLVMNHILECHLV